MYDTPDASKDFFDPVKGRRILWGWAQVPPASTQTLPREVTWHPQLNQLVFSPLAEQSHLREIPALAEMATVSVPAGVHKSLGTWADSRGNQSEVTATFPIPARNATFGIGLMTNGSGTNPTLEAFVEYTTPPAGLASTSDSNFTPHAVNVGVRPTTRAHQRLVHTGTASGRGQKHPLICPAGEQPCKSHPMRCCCVKPPCVVAPPRGAQLQLLPTDTEIEIKVFVDNTFAE